MHAWLACFTYWRRNVVVYGRRNSIKNCTVHWVCKSISVSLPGLWLCKLHRGVEVCWTLAVEHSVYPFCYHVYLLPHCPFFGDRLPRCTHNLMAQNKVGKNTVRRCMINVGGRWSQVDHRDDRGPGWRPPRDLYSLIGKAKFRYGQENVCFSFGTPPLTETII